MDDDSAKASLFQFNDNDFSNSKSITIKNWTNTKEDWSGTGVTLKEWSKENNACPKNAYVTHNFFGYKLYLSNKKELPDDNGERAAAPLTNDTLESKVGYEGDCYCYTDYPVNGEEQFKIKIASCSTHARTCSSACSTLLGGGLAGYIWLGDFPDADDMLKNITFSNIPKPDKIEDCKITKNPVPRCYAYIDPTGNERSRATYWGIDPENGYEPVSIITSKEGCDMLSEQVDGRIIRNTDEYNNAINIADSYEYELIGSNEVLTPAVKKLLKELYLAIKILTPILAVVLSMFDFAKAIAQEDKDALKKSYKRLTVRIVIVLLVFLLPTLINLIGSITGLGTLPADLF